MRRPLLLLAALALAAAGLLGLGQTRAEGPAPIPVGAFAKERPASPWVRLTGGRLDVLEGAFVRSKAGAITDLLVPLRGQEEPPNGPIQVVVRVRAGDPLFDLLHRGDSVTEAEAGAFLQDSREAMVPRRPVEGVVVEPGERDLRKLQAMQPKLAPGWVLLEEGATPARGTSWPLLAAAAVLALLGLFRLPSRPQR